jgi:hypothetical protein
LWLVENMPAYMEMSPSVLILHNSNVLLPCTYPFLANLLHTPYCLSSNSFLFHHLSAQSTNLNTPLQKPALHEKLGLLAKGLYQIFLARNILADNGGLDAWQKESDVLVDIVGEEEEDAEGGAVADLLDDGLDFGRGRRERGGEKKWERERDRTNLVVWWILQGESNIGATCLLCQRSWKHRTSVTI